MEATTIQRKQTSFRLRTDLLDFMKKDAERANRTLNNFLESLLLDYYYNEPNEVTKAAIEEAMSGRNRNKVYTDVDEMFDDILKLAELKKVLKMLEKENPLPRENLPHPLHGNYEGCIECHIQGDFLLIWVDPKTDIIELVRLGTHSELFGKSR